MPNVDGSSARCLGSNPFQPTRLANHSAVTLEMSGSQSEADISFAEHANRILRQHDKDREADKRNHVAQHESSGRDPSRLPSRHRLVLRGNWRGDDGRCR